MAVTHHSPSSSLYLNWLEITRITYKEYSMFINYQNRLVLPRVHCNTHAWRSRVVLTDKIQRIFPAWWRPLGIDFVGDAIPVELKCFYLKKSEVRKLCGRNVATSFLAHNAIWLRYCHKEWLVPYHGFVLILWQWIRALRLSALSTLLPFSLNAAIEWL